jgi:hypothetical protein
MIRKLFCALTISFVLCGNAFASNEIQFDGGAAFTGQTLYFVLTVGPGHGEAGESWDGSNFITYTTTRSTLDVAMTEVGVTGRFRGSLPTAATAINKPIIATVYQDADDNGTPDHEDDIALQTTEGLWNGLKLTSQTINAWHSTTVGSVTSATIISLASTGGAGSANCYKGCTIKITDNADPLEFVYGVVTANTEVDLTYNLTDGQTGLTVTTGMLVDIYQPSFTFDDRDFLNDIPASVADTGGPIEQREVAPARTLQARSRGDGTFGVVGNQRIRMMPGETTLWAVEFRGTQVPVNNNLNGMEEPDVTGADAAQMVVGDYGVDDTAAKFELTLDDDAEEDDEINVRLEVHPTGVETVIVIVPVTVGS